MMDTREKLGTDLYLHTDYREFLRQVFGYWKANKPQFSFRFFAKQAGFGGQSYLKMVIDGERNLTPDSVTKFVRALRLDKKQTDYFEAMVFYTQAKNEDEKERYYNQMMKLRPKMRLKGIDKDQYEYLTDSLYVAIREMAALGSFKDDPKWIAARLRYPTSSVKVGKALDVLKRLGLVTKNKKGELVHSGGALQSPVDLESVEYLHCHRKILTESRDLIMSAPFDEWDMASVTIPLSKKRLPQMMEILRHAIQEIVELANEDKGNFEEVYQANYQLFPLTRVERLEDEEDKNDDEQDD